MLPTRQATKPSHLSAAVEVAVQAVSWIVQYQNVCSVNTTCRRQRYNFVLIRWRLALYQLLFTVDVPWHGRCLLMILLNVHSLLVQVLQTAPVLAAVTTVQTRPWVPCACVPLACSWVTTCRTVKVWSREYKYWFH